MFDGTLYDPLLINATVDPEGFWFKGKQTDDCTWKVDPISYYKLYDRFGLAHEGILEIVKEERQHWIPVTGNPPYLFLGDSNPCSNLKESLVEGVSEGTKTRALVWPYDPDSGRMAESFHEDVVEIKLGIPESNASATWLPENPHIWNTMMTSVDAPRSGPNAFSGTVKTYYPDGTLLRSYTFPLSGPKSVSGVTLQYYPGAYTIEVERDLPRGPTTVEFWMQYWALTPAICDHAPFEWEMCT